MLVAETEPVPQSISAKAMLIAVPWTLLAVSLTFFVSVYAIEAAVEARRLRVLWVFWGRFTL